MTMTVNGPDGVTVNFPDGTDPETIQKVMMQAVGIMPETDEPAEDLMVPRPTKSSAFAAQQNAIRTRNGVLREEPQGSRLGDILKPVFGGHNPIAETYDNFIEPFLPSEPRTKDENALQEFESSRTPLDRAAGAANFLVSTPVRIATEGKYGAGDVLTALGLPAAGTATTRSEEDFARANAPQLEALQKAGDLAAGTAGIDVARPTLPSATKIHRPELPGPRAGDAAADLAAFQNADVRPFGPAFSQGPIAGVAKSLADTPIVGSPVRNALEESIGGAARAADDVASRFGNAATEEQAGRAVQEGIQRFRDERPDDVVRERLQTDRPSTTTAPLTIEHLPQQVLQKATDLDRMTPADSFQPVERQLLERAGIRPQRQSDGNLLYDTAPLRAELQRRASAGEIDTKLGPDNTDYAAGAQRRQRATEPPEQYLRDIIAAPARETSRKTKTEALYDEAWNHIPPEMQIGRSREGDSRFLGGLGNTANELDRIIDRNLGMMNRSRAGKDGTIEITRSGEEIAPVGRQVTVRGGTIPEAALPAVGGQLGRILRDIASRRWRGTLQDMRELRSALRRLSSGMPDTEKNTLQKADVERLRAAVSRDMAYTLERNAAAYRAQGETQTAAKILRAAQLFRRADNFYRLSQKRLDAIDALFGAKNPEAVYRNIIQAAQIKGGSLQKLRALARILRKEERGELAAGILNQLGKPIGSARGLSQEIGFSVNSWLTNWLKLSPDAKKILFTKEHIAALDDLARIAHRLSNVESLANSSRSGLHLTNVAGLAAAGGSLATGNWLYLMGAAGAHYGASLLLSRPAYAKWAVQYAKLRAKALSGPKAVIRPLHEQVRNLAIMAKSDPRLIPLVVDIAKDNGLDVDPEETR